MEVDFTHLVEDISNETEEADDSEETVEAVTPDGDTESPSARSGAFARPKGLFDDEDEVAPEDMPVTIVVKADSANTLASILDALGDWGDVETQEEMTTEALETPSEAAPAGSASGSREAIVGEMKSTRYEWGEGDLQHKQRQRLVVSVARSGVGAVTTSDVRLARDCECPVFAHNVKADAAAAKEIKRVGGEVLSAVPEGVVVEGIGAGVGGKEGFIGRAGEGRECVVVSETVGELLGEIERFVLRVR